jgi:hypothetical protein
MFFAIQIKDIINFFIKMPIISRISELERFTIYEYVDICTIPKLYYRDRKLFDIIIKKYNKEKAFSLVDPSFLKMNYEKLKIQVNDVVVNGDLECIKWLKEQNCPWDSWTFPFAAYYRNIEVMKWLKENNCPWNTLTFAWATLSGDLEKMKWLKENNCPWNGTTFSSAAEYGNLDNMKWLKEQNCPWDSDTFWKASTTGKLENMKWLKDNECPWAWKFNG